MHYPPDQVALQQIDLSIGEGDFVFITGPSGAGKSTLLKLLYGAERATRGEVKIGSCNLSAADPNAIAKHRRDIGFIFQDYRLLPRRSVVDNVAFGLEVRGIESAGRKILAERILKSVGLRDKAAALPPTLSGGEQQRAAIARALIRRPQFILADEPTGNLDRKMSTAVFDLLLEANARGVTVVVATHDLGTIDALGKRTIVLDRGKVIGDFDSPQALH